MVEFTFFENMSRKPLVTVFTAGCFNRIHKAHIRMLLWARSLGDRLVIVLAHDAHNHKPNALSAHQRAQNLRGLKIAQKVVIGDPMSFARSLRREKPQILALGYDQKIPDAQTEALARGMGIHVIVMPWTPGKEEHHDCDYLLN